MKRLFMCEWCGEIYDDEFKAKKCERGHLIPLNVTPSYYDNQKKIPELVTVDFGEHTEIYRLVGGNKEKIEGVQL
jgi:hypothetical protein